MMHEEQDDIQKMKMLDKEERLAIDEFTLLKARILSLLIFGILYYMWLKINEYFDDPESTEEEQQKTCKKCKKFKKSFDFNEFREKFPLAAAALTEEWDSEVKLDGPQLYRVEEFARKYKMNRKIRK